MPNYATHLLAMALYLTFRQESGIRQSHLTVSFKESPIFSAKEFQETWDSLLFYFLIFFKHTFCVHVFTTPKSEPYSYSSPLIPFREILMQHKSVACFQFNLDGMTSVCLSQKEEETEVEWSRTTQLNF